MHLKIKVHPGSKEEKVIKKAEDSFEIYVREKPERGLANKAFIEALSLYLKVPPRKIRLIKEARSKNKIFEVSS